MKEIKPRAKELVLLTILVALAVSVVNAAVFVYYPIDISAAWSIRPIYFSTTGTNAGGPDLGSGNTITVSLSEDGTDADISVHPSRRGTTRYKNVMEIINGDTQTYYLWIRVNTAFDSTDIAEAKLIVGTTEINLKTTGASGPITLSGGGSLGVDLRFRISASGSGSDTASLELIYSPQSTESPP